MKGPNLGLLTILILSALIVGYIKAEPDFEFAEEKASLGDDEDFMRDQEGSGDIDGSGEPATGEPATGVPALFRAVINITSLQYTEEIRAAGRDIGGLAITQQLQTALQNLLNTLPGDIRIRIVDLQPGSLMVTFDIDTDGEQTEEEIIQLLKDTLNRGDFSGYRVSPDGFDFRRIRDTFTCSPRVGPVPRKLPTPFPDNYAYLMINNVFPCNGYVTAWNFQREFPGETVFIGIFRQTSETNFALIDATEIPRLTQDRYELAKPLLVQKGDFVGIFNQENDRGGNLAFTTEATAGVQDYELYQGYRLKMFAKDIMTGAPFQISDFENSETKVMFAVQADMSYLNVPEITTQAPSTCNPQQWTCKNGECIDLTYYCDQQVDCYDGSDEENCPAGTLTCEDNEFRCANGQQCIPLQFICNFVNDCGDNSDEVSCGPGPVRITSYRDSSESDRYTISWVRPQAGGGDIISYTIKYRPVTVRRGDFTSEGDYIIERYLGDVTEIQLSDTADNYVLSSLQPASYYQVEISANNRIGASEPRAFIFRTANAGCPPGQYQCVDGGCIDNSVLCDSVPDCADGSDEGAICGSNVCLEGLEACPQPDGTIRCVEKAIGCVDICAENEFQCLDGRGCISFSSLCDGRIDCNDLSDEANCECAEGEFQCVEGRNCISGNRRCDSRTDCADGSDETNCPCPDGFFQCLNTPSQECISTGLLCDDVNDCSDGSDEINCGCAAGKWQCADRSCIPENMRCDGRPQCEDSSDEVGCRRTCRPDQYTCLDGNCVEGRMRCDGIPQCEDGSDEVACIVTCRSDQYTCLDGNCVEGRMRCDGIPQCEDGSDEVNCPKPACREGMFQCDDGNCVEGRMACDGVPQCEDGSDEFGCPTEPPSCPTSDFQCESTGFLECIDKRLVCDGYPDCSDSSDEKDCPGCRRDEFTCRSDGRCLPSSSRCNLVIECADRSDELGCNCTAEQFRCGDGICIDLSRRCDRRMDCEDRSDELACPCRSGQYQCLNGDCIDDFRRCDGVPDCQDRSDESGCPCRSGEYQCSNGECIEESRRCDGEVDCRDRSDEAGCPSRRRCPEGYFQCGSGHCLSEPRHCDGVPDCPDQSDERDCPLRCEAGEMECVIDNKCLSADQICNRVYDCSDGRDERDCERCASGEFQCESDRSCISSAGRCNGRKECSDGSDEMGCPTPAPITVVVSPQNLRIRQGAEAIMTCVAQGLPAGARVEWFRGTVGLPMQSAVEQGKLMIPVAKVMDSGDYTCRVVGVPGNYQATARLEVVAIGPTPRPDGETGKCGRDEAVCQNGECIRREYRCDREEDCSDGSDEPDDCYTNLCEPNEFQCPSGQCVMKIWRCDGENDCDDGFDETDCQAKLPDDPCGRDEFQCVSGNQCVPLAYQCDKEIDCLDRSDEIGCSPPIITLPPVAEIEVELGGTFTIICEAVGVPTPLIVWRLNWGNIPTGDRVTTISEEGRGVLTISDARDSDAGAYTCEAINNRGSIFAIPDALVIVRLILTGKEENLKENIIIIGGSDFMDLNVEQKYLLVGLSSQCNKDLDLSMAGSTFYASCSSQERKVEISYVDRSTVDLEIVKKVTLIEMRGDVLPDTEQDLVVWHIGGLPPELKEGVKHLQIIRGVTASDSTMRRRVIEIGGRKRNKYQIEKQVIHIGLSQDCTGELKLVDHSSERKALQCLMNGSEVIYRTANRSVLLTGKGEGQLEKASEIIYVAGKVPQKTRKKLSRVVGVSSANLNRQDIIEVKENKIVRDNVPEITENRKVNDVTGPEVIEIERKNIENIGISKTSNINISEGEKGIKTLSQIEIIEIAREKTTEAPVEVHTQRSLPILVSENVEIVKTGNHTKTKTVSEEIVLVGERHLTQRIVGKIFEVNGASRVETKNEDKYVEIGAGSPCRNQLEIRLLGSALTSTCEGRNVTIDYIGQGPTDLEILHSTYLVEDDKALLDFQKEDFILIYVGGIPSSLKSKTMKSYFIRGVSPRKERSGQRLKKERIVEIIGRGRKIKRLHRQVVMIGVSRNCEDLLRTVSVSGKSIVECAKIDKKEIKEIGYSVEDKERESRLKEIVIHGGPGNIDTSLKMSIKSETTTQVIDRHTQTEPVETVSEYIEERLLMIGGTDSVTIDEATQQVSIGFRGSVCNNAKSYRILSQDNNLIIDCQGRWSPINIIYMGQTSTDIYLSKSVIVIHERPTQKKDLVLCFGGNAKEKMSKKKVVEIIRNIGQSRRTGVSKMMTFGGQSTNNGSRTILEVGFSVECRGYLHKEDVYGRIIVSCRRGGSFSRKSENVQTGGKFSSVTEKRNTVVISGQPSNDKIKKDKVVVISGHTPREDTMIKGSVLKVMGNGAEEKAKSDLNEIVIVGVPAESRESEKVVEKIDSETTVTNKTVILGGIGKEEGEKVISISGKGADVTDNKTVIIGGSDVDLNQKIIVAGMGGKKNRTVDIKVEPKIITKERVDLVGVKTRTRGKITTEAPRTTVGLGIIERNTKKPTELEIVGKQVDEVYLTGDKESVLKVDTSPTKENIKSGMELGAIETVEEESKLLVSFSEQKMSTGKDKNVTLSSGVTIEKVVLVAKAEYVRLNETDQSLELGFIDHCEGDFSVIANNRRLRVICSDGMNGVEFQYIGREVTDIEVRTNVRFEQTANFNERRDKVFIQLGGFLENTDSDKKNIDSYSIVANQDVMSNESKLISVKGFTESEVKNTINVVEIVIKKTCKSGGISKYVDEEGTVVYCSRRADILPEKVEDGDGIEREKAVNRTILNGARNGLPTLNKVDTEIKSVEFSNIRNVINDKDLLIAVTEEKIGSSKDGVILYFQNTSGSNSETKSSLTDTNEEDDYVPTRRGDLSIEEVYGKEFTNAYQTHRSAIPLIKYETHKGSGFGVKQVNNNHFSSFNDGSETQTGIPGKNILDYDIGTGGSVDLDLGNNCKGKIEAIEVDDGVIVKCSIGDELFQINLVGFGRVNNENTWSGFQIQNDESSRARFLENEGNLITEREVVVPGKGKMLGKDLTVHEVFYASRKTHINKGIEHHRRQKRSTVAEEVGQTWINKISSKIIIPKVKDNNTETEINKNTAIEKTDHKVAKPVSSINGLESDMSIKGFNKYIRHPGKGNKQQSEGAGKRLKSLKGKRDNKINSLNFVKRKNHKRFKKYDSSVRNGLRRQTGISRKFSNKRRHAGHIRRRAVIDKTLVNKKPNTDMSQGPDSLYFHPLHNDNPGDLRFAATGILLKKDDEKRSDLKTENTMHLDRRKNEWTDNGYRRRTRYEKYRKRLLQNRQSQYTTVNDERSKLRKKHVDNGGFELGRDRGIVGNSHDEIIQVNSEVLFGSGTIGGQPGPCSPPFFNSVATRSDDCVRCFCFGHTVQCFSSDLQVSRIALVNPIQFTRRESDGELVPVDQTFVNFRQRTGEYQVQDMTRALPQGRYYWKLPREFIGERLTSYGGEIKYTITYEIQGRSRATTSDADVVMSGNGITLFYRGRTVPSPGVPTSVSVPLLETAWERSDGTRRRGDTPVDTQYANREDFMTVLENVEYILIRGSYDRTQTLSRIGGVFMTTAVDYATEFGQAYLVEECTCPTGYSGLSCQDCAPGFTRIASGPYLGQCVSCNCNGHSNDCDPISGQCLNCLHNTEGPQCQLCITGYYGDARRGTPNDCQACPCPLTDRANQFSRTCFLDTQDGEVTCANCPAGYEGRRCQRCADGYVGDPMTPGSSCTKVPVDDYCDPRGSLSTQPNPFTNACDCRANAFGERCDTCKENTFYLSSSYELGCVRCFCMGVSSLCQSTTWNRAQVGLSFSRDEAGVRIVDMNGNALQDQRLTTDTNNRELVYRTRDLNENTLYWSLPSSFLGDKITAYGGSLRFTIRYSSRQGQAISDAEPLVKISGNDITLIHRSRQDFQPNRPQPVSIMMYEQNWYRSDGQAATREHLLMALADLDSILIRASFEKPQVDTGLRDVTLDVAESRQTRQDRAYAVESCQCPVGYRGLSCEDCDTGFTRSGGGLYLGLCEPCRCNGHSSECDPETGVCRNCQHNTEGDSCEMCAVGFYGDATQGRRDACQRCPCPLTESPNQFSPTCILDTDGQVTCTACPAGHTGRRCETCVQGYSGNPLKVGDYCRIRTGPTCDCDSRGIVPNTQCDEVTQQCQCKPYVQGVRCARCREGHFYLESNNPQGCLTCFCSGITNQCTSSNYYRESLRPVLGSDGRHNFVLMNRRMNNIISDGFVVDSNRNQVTFNQFEGVQQERESLFFQLPAKFRGDRVTSYGGYLRFTLEFSARPEGRTYRDVDLEIISTGQALRLYHLFEPGLQEGRTQTYEILLRESSFNDLRSNTAPTRETFMTILSDIAGILIRATYHQNMASVTLRDVSMDTAVATPTNLGGAPMVEDCRCPEGYTGLSCQRCADGYLQVSDGRGGVGRCVRCNCNGHATSCDPESGRCLECQHNTEGDRCERCATGFYGDATSGTPNDCRACPCPLSTAPNQFSRTCYLAEDNQVTCDRCPTGYTGRQCEVCADGYVGDPTQPGGSCSRADIDLRPGVAVSPLRVEEPEGSTVVYQCQVSGEGPFNVVWSRLDSRQLPDRATVSPRYSLTIRNLERDDTGRYICTATNRYGVTRREVELIVIYGRPPLQVRIDKTRLEVEEGRTARFVCTITGTSREMTYILSWSKQGGQMPAKAIDQNGVLVIPNAQRSDAGNYVCMGSDMTSMDEAVAVLIVSEGADQAPTVRIEPRYQEVDEGTPVRFNCIATGEPTPRIEWYRGSDREMNPEATISSDGVFRIPRVRLEDESDYYCKATNDLGTAEVRTILYVTRVEKPEITIIVRRTKYVSIVGDTARLECYSEDASGRVTLFWSRATGLPSGSSQDNGILTIPDVQPSYAGNYVCTGTDRESGRVGTAIAVLEVQIEEDNEPPKVSLEQEKITIPMGSTGTLRCQVTGKPEPKVTWLKSREDLAPNHQVNGNVLRITQATMADRGIYVCRAENAVGLDQDWTVVEVERRMRPKIDLYPNTTQRVSVGGSVLFQCRVMDGDPPPTVTWSRVGGAPMPSDKIETMENGVIMFKQVTQAEQGGYICTAENDMGTTTATATLTVEGPPTITIQPSKTVYALIGQRVTLECTADGDPLPAVYWIEPVRRRRGDVPPEVDRLSGVKEYGTSVVDIASVETEDQGTYTCVASNTGGKTEDRVQLVVRDGEPRGLSITGPGTLSVVEGQSVELICSATDLRNPVIRWRRREGILPAGHSVRNGVLNLPRFRSEYAGEYICSTTVQQQLYEASVFIIVTVTPRLTISPQRITSRAGDTIQLRCTASGAGPFNIEWSRIGAQMNPSATERDGVLEIRQVTAADAGRYRCSIQSSSGTSDGYALVEIEVPPSVVVTQRDVYTEENRIATLRCDVSGSPTPIVRWEKEGDQLPAQHKIQDGTLTIYGVREEDAGRYICTASSTSGSSRDYAVLHVTTETRIDNNGGSPDTLVFNVGDKVSMECIVTGTPLPTITWSRDDGPLPKDAILGDGILIIPQAKIEDAGTYTCRGVNEAGSVTSKVVLYIRAQPFLSAPSASTAALGDRATLVCDASGYPSPDITWFRKDGEMPSDYTIVDGDLVISRVKPEDAGTYVCHAENQYGKTDVPVSLNVGDLVPYFSQNPKSYISYPAMNDVYLDFDILLSLKPESTEGMVLYNGQYQDGGGDFVCFGLNEGYPEFRFDVGSGPAIIRGNNTLPLNEWHTIQLKRDRKKGSMVVNEEPAYTGESPGLFTGLDLEGKMYLGAVPNFDNIPRVAGFKEGFVGSVSEVRLKGIELNLGAEALEIVGVEPYNTCRKQPCVNGGNCVPANTRYGFRCLCQQGFTGSRCEEIGESCYPGSCGRGRCYNLEGRSGFRCICPLGKTGMGCQADVAIINPFFNRTSFISFPPSEGALFALQIQLEFKPQSLSDGIILYEGNDKDGTGDFMAIIQKDGYLEFRFDTGSGPAVIRSRNPLRVNEWTRVTATRKNREGTLVVNDDEPVTDRTRRIQSDQPAAPAQSDQPAAPASFYTYYNYKFKRYRRGTSPGSTVGLNLKLPLYLGGPDPTAQVSPSTGVSRGFIGCVAELTVNDVKIDLLNDAIESANIVDCGERRLCARKPCENDAVCEDLPGPAYRCICPASHTGKNCESEINICLTNSPCMNGAPCSVTNTGYRCDCPLRFAGDNCEYEINLNTQYEFAGDGFMELPKGLLPHDKTQERQTISFNIRTTQRDGLIFWQGEQGGRPLRGGDHISLGLKDGYVEFSYEMGSGSAMIMSRKRVDDGQTHTVSVERLGRSGTLKVDNDDTVYGDSLGFLQMLNADGNIYIGGVSLTDIMTDGKFTDNFIGCIGNVNIHGKGPIESRDAIGGYNVQNCSP